MTFERQNLPHRTPGFVSPSQSQVLETQFSFDDTTFSSKRDEVLREHFNETKLNSVCEDDISTQGSAGEHSNHPSAIRFVYKNQKTKSNQRSQRRNSNSPRQRSRMSGFVSPNPKDSNAKPQSLSTGTDSVSKPLQELQRTNTVELNHEESQDWNTDEDESQVFEALPPLNTRNTNNPPDSRSNKPAVLRRSNSAPILRYHGGMNSNPKPLPRRRCMSPTVTSTSQESQLKKDHVSQLRAVISSNSRVSLFGGGSEFSQQSLSLHNTISQFTLPRSSRRHVAPLTPPRQPVKLKKSISANRPATPKRVRSVRASNQQFKAHLCLTSDDETDSEAEASDFFHKPPPTLLPDSSTDGEGILPTPRVLQPGIMTPPSPISPDTSSRESTDNDNKNEECLSRSHAPKPEDFDFPSTPNTFARREKRTSSWHKRGGKRKAVHTPVTEMPKLEPRTPEHIRRKDTHAKSDSPFLEQLIQTASPTQQDGTEPSHIRTLGKFEFTDSHEHGHGHDQGEGYDSSPEMVHSSRRTDKDGLESAGSILSLSEPGSFGLAEGGSQVASRTARGSQVVSMTTGGSQVASRTAGIKKRLRFSPESHLKAAIKALKCRNNANKFGETTNVPGIVNDLASIHNLAADEQHKAASYLKLLIAENNRDIKDFSMFQSRMKRRPRQAKIMSFLSKSKTSGLPIGQIIKPNQTTLDGRKVFLTGNGVAKASGKNLVKVTAFDSQLSQTSSQNAVKPRQSGREISTTKRARSSTRVSSVGGSSSTGSCYFSNPNPNRSSNRNHNRRHSGSPSSPGLIGKRLCIFRPNSFEYASRCGTIIGFETSGRNKDRHLILYEGGAREYIDLHKVKFKWMKDDISQEMETTSMSLKAQSVRQHVVSRSEKSSLGRSRAPNLQTQNSTKIIPARSRNPAQKRHTRSPLTKPKPSKMAKTKTVVLRKARARSKPKSTSATTPTNSSNHRVHHQQQLLTFEDSGSDDSESQVFEEILPMKLSRPTQTQSHSQRERQINELRLKKSNNPWKLSSKTR